MQILSFILVMLTPVYMALLGFLCMYLSEYLEKTEAARKKEEEYWLEREQMQNYNK